MAQPTVARRIEVLEHELGLTLFERDTRGFCPTEAGKSMVAAAEAIETATASFADQAAGLTAVRPIRITAFAENLSSATTHILSEFSLLHPEVVFEFISSARVLDLMKGEADVALRVSMSPQDPALICRQISTAKFTVYAAPSYIEKHGQPRSPAELKDHILLTLRRNDIPASLHDWTVKHAGAAAVKRSFSEVMLLNDAIVSGQGIGIRNVRQSMPEVAAGKLIACFEPPSELNAQHQVLVSPEAYRRPEVRAFTKFFAPQYAKLFN